VVSGPEVSGVDVKPPQLDFESVMPTVLILEPLVVGTEEEVVPLPKKAEHDVGDFFCGHPYGPLSAALAARESLAPDVGW
jgi:hypothetical protein